MANFLPHLLSSLEYAFAIITLLGGVIAIHEFGHFIFAKWCGIRVDTFSLGFGPKLFAKKIGETEYCLSLVPLGGFVKIYGQDPEELKTDENPQPARAFSEKNLYQKISVLIGGPLFNYILAIFIFSLLAVAGMHKFPASATRIVYGSPAFHAGLRSGDQIQAVQGKAAKTFDDIEHAIVENADKTLEFQILRNGQRLKLPIPIQKESAFTPYGESSQAGVLEGFEPVGREALFAVATDSHPWGIKNGDKLLSFNGRTISSWEDLEATLEITPSADTISLQVLRNGKTIDLSSPNLSSLKLKITPWNAQQFLDANALYNPELFVEEVMKGSPAEKAGLKKADHLIAVDGKAVYSFNNLRSAIQNAGEQLVKNKKLIDGGVKLTLERSGKILELPVTVAETKSKDPLGKTILTYTVGIASSGKMQLPSNMILERTYNPFRALYKGISDTAYHTVITVVGIKKLAFGEVSLKSVGGPIMIGKLAGETLSSRGWRDFLQVMAIISISLGVFNLLPVPILDGGHIVVAIIESVRGKPISQQVSQIFMKVGLSLILILMVFAFYNDISRVLF